MSSLKSRFTRLSAAIAVTTIFTLGAALPAFAADKITSTLTGGSITASVADVSLDAASYAHANQDDAGSMTLTADDSTASGEGWDVTVLSSAFVYTGTNGGTNIPAANFSIILAGDPVMTAGQAVDDDNGPKVDVVSGSLETARRVLTANAGFGQGTYTQVLGVSLLIPGQSRAGTYTGTLTISIAAAP
jgi:hypothetical protein